MGRKPSFSVDDIINGFVVLELLPSGKTGEHRKYKVMCPRCNQSSIMLPKNIRNANSCGCLKKDSSTWKRKGAINKPWKLPKGEASFNCLYHVYSHSAIKRNLLFELSKEEFKKIIVQPCYYCGSCCQSIKLSARSNGGFKYTGIDRKDNKIGYIFSNSVPCCKTCNFMKLDHNYDFFLSHLQKILTYHGNENHKQLV